MARGSVVTTSPERTARGGGSRAVSSLGASMFVSFYRAQFECRPGTRVRGLPRFSDGQIRERGLCNDLFRLVSQIEGCGFTIALVVLGFLLFELPESECWR